MFHALNHIFFPTESRHRTENHRDTKALFSAKSTLSKKNLAWSTYILSNLQQKSGAHVFVQYFKSNPELISKDHALTVDSVECIIGRLI